MLIDISENVSPTLTNGSFDVYFGKFGQVKAALVTYDQSMNLDSSSVLCMSYNYNPIDTGSLNYVRIFFTQTGASTRIQGTTAMLAGKKVVVLARGT